MTKVHNYFGKLFSDFMKRVSALNLLALVLAGPVFAQPASSWVNNSVISCPPEIPPQIDALNFINNAGGQIFIAFTNFTINPELFDTSDTVNFTNFGTIDISAGMHFDTAPAVSGSRHSAENVFNSGNLNALGNGLVFVGGGGIVGGGIVAGGITFEGLISAPKIIASAGNIVNPGTMDVGPNGLLKLTGDNLNLDHGSLIMEGFGSGGIVGSFGIFDNYWGSGTNRTTPATQYNDFFPFTSIHTVTQLVGTVYLTFQTQLAFQTPQTYIDDVTVGTNRTVQIVFLQQPNPAISNNVYFSPGQGIAIEWIAMATNPVTGLVTTNYLNLLDNYELNTNNIVITNRAPVTGRGTFIPTNLFLFQGGPFFTGLTPSPQGTTAGAFDLDQTTTVTNEFAAYSALITPATQLPSEIPGGQLTNIAGRIELTASNVLSLDHTKISGLDFVSIKAPNQFAGNNQSQISSPYVDLTLRTTNNTLSITNFLMPLARISGEIDLYRARWTNITITATGTNQSIYHVLFVNSDLQTTTPTIVNDLSLTGPNVVISDVLNVQQGFFIDAQSLTVTTNTGVGAFYPSGQINLLSENIVWSQALPHLQNLTNYGTITALNTIFFGGQRTSPYQSTGPADWYQNFVNTGLISDEGTFVWSRYFENEGEIFSGGSISVESQVGLMTNGIFLAGADISLAANSLFISNTIVQAGGAVTLSATNYLDDGTITAGCPDFNTNKNSWIGRGFSLTSLPPLASLQSTSFRDIDTNQTPVVNTWAGADKGNSPSGFDNNAAVGRLFIDGEDPLSLFIFQGTSGNNALYVDYLEFDNYATNRDIGGTNFVQVSIAPGMKIYFGQATASGVSIAEKLDGANGGRFVWVRDYNCGFYSSTNLVYPDGSTNRVNTALATSCNIDSDNDGIVNCADLSPVPPSQLSPCPCNATSVPLNLSGNGGSGAGSGSGSASTNSGSKLGFPTVAGGGGTNPVVLASASYSGLFYETNGVAAPSSGYFTAITSSRGTYTGKLSSGGRAYPFSGTFDPVTGLSSTPVKRGMLHSLTLNLQLDSGANQIRGSVSDGNWTAGLMADKLVFSKAAHASQAGAYTFIIPGDSQDASNPAGHSFGRVSVDTSGNVTWSGALADGSKVTQKSTVSADGIWPLYSSLYSGKGCVLGWIQFTNNTADGNVVWVKSAGISGKYYPGGFTNLLGSFGSAYHKPSAGTRALDWGGGLGEVSVSGGGLSHSLTDDIRLELNNRVTNLSGPKLTLSITTSSGLFRGTFVDPDTRKAIPFQGVLLQDSNGGLGYFLGSDQSGEIRLGPPQ